MPDRTGRQLPGPPPSRPKTTSPDPPSGTMRTGTGPARPLPPPREHWVRKTLMPPQALLLRRSLRTLPRPPPPRSPAWPEFRCRPLPFPTQPEPSVKPSTEPPGNPGPPLPPLSPSPLLPVREPDPRRTGCRAAPYLRRPPRRPLWRLLPVPPLVPPQVPPQRARQPVPPQAPPFLLRGPLPQARTPRPLTRKPLPPLPLILLRRRFGRGARQHPGPQSRVRPFPARYRQVPPRPRPQRRATPVPRRLPTPRYPVPQRPVPHLPVPLRGVPRLRRGMPVLPSQLQHVQRQGQPREPLLLPPLPRRTSPLCCRRPLRPRCLPRPRPLRRPFTWLRRRPEHRCWPRWRSRCSAWPLRRRVTT